MPKLSIITITLNNIEGLKKTINSVKIQSYKNYEHIIIDGDSNDGTKEFLDENKTLFSKVISEKDRGIYDAMNKGILLASGEYINFMNAGDIFYNEKVLEKVLLNEYNESLIYGDVIIKKNDSTVLKKVKEIDIFFLYNDTICHQAQFIKKDLFIDYGFYDINFKIAADHEFLVKILLKYNANFKYTNEIISVYDGNGISGSTSYNLILSKEKELIINRYFSVLLLNSIKVFNELDLEKKYHYNKNPIFFFIRRHLKRVVSKLIKTFS